MDLEQLRSKAASLRACSSSPRFHWPKDFKRDVVEANKLGSTIMEISRATNIPSNTIRSWLDKPKQSSFKQVKVIPSVNELTLRWEGGLEVEGISFEQFKILLQEQLL